MMFRYGLLWVLRGRRRLALFLGLVMALTACVTLSLGMLFYSRQMLARCDDYYTSIAVVEYRGGDTSDQDAADDYARAAADLLDDEAIRGVEGVLRWERWAQVLASLEGYTRTSGTIPYGDMGVITVEHILSTPVYTDQLTALPADQQPELLAAMSTQSSELVVVERGMPVLTVPIYTYDPDSGQCETLCWNPQLGAAEEVTCPASELAGTYVLKDPQREGAGGFSIHDESDYRLSALLQKLYQYDPETGEVLELRQVVAGYDAMIGEVFYARDDVAGSLVVLPADASGFVPEPGKRYVLHGAFYTSALHGGLAFQVLDFDGEDDTLPYLELEPGEGVPEDSPFAARAALYQNANNYIRLTFSGDISALKEFQQGYLRLEQGRFPAEGEQGACVVSGATARAAGLTLGDSIQLNVLRSQPDDRFQLTQGEERLNLTVVGITDAGDDYDGCVWTAPEPELAEPELYGYTLGQAVVDNANGPETVQALQALMPSQVQVTLYDQGYSSASQPLRVMGSTALAMALASILGTLAVLTLFAYLFVGQQRDTLGLLRDLGAPEGAVNCWLLSGATVVSAAAVLLGGALGWLLQGRVLTGAHAALQTLYRSDTRYSDANLGLSLELRFDGEIPLWYLALVLAGVFLTGVVLCVAFLGRAYAQDNPARGRQVRIPRGKTWVWGRGVLRQALRNLVRRGCRSWVVPALALCLILVMGVLAASGQSRQQQLDQLYNTTQISGQLMSQNGRYDSNLVIGASTVRTLWNSGLLDHLSVSTGWHYWLAQEMPDFGTGEFAQARRNAWISRQPQLTALNSLEAAAEFFRAPPQVEWLEGWDESFLARPGPGWYENSDLYPGLFDGEPEPVPALASRQFLEEQGWSLGDVVTVWFRAGDVETACRLQIVGTFARSSARDNLYVPLSFGVPPELLLGQEDVITGSRPPSAINSVQELERYQLLTTSFAACRFTLASARQLEDLRDYLAAQGFSQVGTDGTIRTAVVLGDGLFQKTVRDLSRSIIFERLLLPTLLVIEVGVSVTVIWLLLSGRRGEIALLRGIGAGRGTVFALLFLEYALLSLAGCLGAGLLMALFLDTGGAGWSIAGVFFLCNLAGCGLDVGLVNRVTLIRLFSEPS